MAAAPARSRLHIPLELSPPPPAPILTDEHTELLRELLRTLQRMCLLLETQAASGRSVRRYRGRHRARPRFGATAAAACLLPLVVAAAAVGGWLAH